MRPVKGSAIIPAVKKVMQRFKKDPILFISGILAAASCFIVPPDTSYIGYINFRVLAILFSLMLTVSAMVRIGTFDYLTAKLLSKVKTAGSVSMLLVIFAFFLSMFLTNDVTLVTVVPFAIAVLGKFGDNKKLMFTLIMLTVAANLGSMMTPIGNPQNLYLFAHYEMEIPDFLRLMLPYTALSLILIAVCVFILCRSSKTCEEKPRVPEKLDRVRLALYVGLFGLSVLCVCGVIHYLLMLAVVAAAVFAVDRKAYIKVDYALLLTFVFFFILIGNIGRIGAVTEYLSAIVGRNPVLTAVIASQIISNVPAAMLLSAFTDDGASLVIGTNLGGLGTLIASMASLITYKFYAALPNGKNGKKPSYLPAFTVINVVLLIILYLFCLVIR